MLKKRSLDIIQPNEPDKKLPNLFSLPNAKEPSLLKEIEAKYLF